MVSIHVPCDRDMVQMDVPCDCDMVQMDVPCDCDMVQMDVPSARHGPNGCSSDRHIVRMDVPSDCNVVQIYNSYDYDMDQMDNSLVVTLSKWMSSPIVTWSETDVPSDRDIVQMDVPLILPCSNKCPSVRHIVRICFLYS